MEEQNTAKHSKTMCWDLILRLQSQSRHQVIIPKILWLKSEASELMASHKGGSESPPFSFDTSKSSAEPSDSAFMVRVHEGGVRGGGAVSAERRPRSTYTPAFFDLKAIARQQWPSLLLLSPAW